MVRMRSHPNFKNLMLIAIWIASLTALTGCPPRFDTNLVVDSMPGAKPEVIDYKIKNPATPENPNPAEIPWVSQFAPEDSKTEQIDRSEFYCEFACALMFSLSDRGPWWVKNHLQYIINDKDRFDALEKMDKNAKDGVYIKAGKVYDPAAGPTFEVKEGEDCQIDVLGTKFQIGTTLIRPGFEYFRSVFYCMQPAYYPDHRDVMHWWQLFPYTEFLSDRGVQRFWDLDSVARNNLYFVEGGYSGDVDPDNPDNQWEGPWVKKWSDQHLLWHILLNANDAVKAIWTTINLLRVVSESTDNPDNLHPFPFLVFLEDHDLANIDIRTSALHAVLITGIYQHVKNGEVEWGFLVHDPAARVGYRERKSSDLAAAMALSDDVPSINYPSYYLSNNLQCPKPVSFVVPLFYDYNTWNYFVGDGTGDNWNTETVVVIKDPTGLGASAQAAIWGGAVTSITVTNGGYGYSAPTVIIAGSGMDATATATVINGAVALITVTNGGTGYGASYSARGAIAKAGVKAFALSGPGCADLLYTTEPSKPWKSQIEKRFNMKKILPLLPILLN